MPRSSTRKNSDDVVYSSAPVLRQKKFASRRRVSKPRHLLPSLEKRQSTLTQIDFPIFTPRSVDDSDGDDSEGKDLEDSRPKKRRRKMPGGKKQTTLTQIDFGRSFSSGEHGQDEGFIALLDGEVVQKEHAGAPIAALRTENMLNDTGATLNVHPFGHLDQENRESPIERPRISRGTSSYTAQGLKTPQKVRFVEVPSSQSPPDTDVSTRSQNRRLDALRSPLAARSPNIGPNEPTVMRSSQKHRDIPLKILRTSKVLRPATVATACTPPKLRHLHTVPDSDPLCEDSLTMAALQDPPKLKHLHTIQDSDPSCEELAATVSLQSPRELKRMHTVQDSDPVAEEPTTIPSSPPELENLHEVEQTCDVGLDDDGQSDADDHEIDTEQHARGPMSRECRDNGIMESSLPQIQHRGAIQDPEEGQIETRTRVRKLIRVHTVQDSDDENVDNEIILDTQVPFERLRDTHSPESQALVYGAFPDTDDEHDGYDPAYSALDRDAARFMQTQRLQQRQRSLELGTPVRDDEPTVSASQGEENRDGACSAGKISAMSTLCTIDVRSFVIPLKSAHGSPQQEQSSGRASSPAHEIPASQATTVDLTQFISSHKATQINNTTTNGKPIPALPPEIYDLVSSPPPSPFKAVPSSPLPSCVLDSFSSSPSSSSIPLPPVLSSSIAEAHDSSGLDLESSPLRRSQHSFVPSSSADVGGRKRMKTAKELLPDSLLDFSLPPPPPISSWANSSR
ncbi:hypothetical protein LTR66_009610 [Elasticomyces elasticus]|nr:hypothetical protein LTR66_009610 [Elasticomyces elasticus]